MDCENIRIALGMAVGMAVEGFFGNAIGIALFYEEPEDIERRQDAARKDG
jgi:hypothetical protein